MAGMDDSGKAWEDVGQRFSQLGRTLRDQYQKRAGQGASAAAESGQKLGRAVQEAIDQLDQVFTSLGETLRDAEAKAKMRDAAQSLGDALETTFTEVGGEIRKALGSSRRRRDDGGKA